MNKSSSIQDNIKSYKRKYYLNQLLKGSLWFGLIWLIYFLLISTLEYFLWFSPTVRTILYWFTIGATSLVVLRFLVFPLIQTIGFFQKKSDEKAADEIGKSLPQVKDRLLNFLQLHQESKRQPQNPWLKASAQQKAESLKGIDFNESIDLQKSNSKLFPWLGAMIVVIVSILMFYPYLITDSAERLLNPNKKYEPVAPFQFVLKNQNLHIPQNEALDIQVHLEGKSIPSELMIELGGHELLMKPMGHNDFSFHIDRVTENLPFRFVSKPFHSQNFQIELIKKITFEDMKVFVDYPSHVGRKDEWLRTLGDIQVPEGTIISWSIFNPNIKNIDALIGGVSLPFQSLNGQNHFVQSFLSDTTIQFVLNHKTANYTDTLTTQIFIIKDQLPSINAEIKVDSSNTAFAVIHGDAADDYGISALHVVMNIKSPDKVKHNTITLPVQSKTYTEFSKLLDFKSLNLPPGSQIEYYVQVTDNDVVHGGKSVRSRMFQYNTPSLEQLQVMEENNAEELINAISGSQSASKKTEKLLNEAERDLLNKSMNSFEDKETFRNLIKANEQLKKNMEKFKDALEKQQEFHKDLANESLKEKEKELNKITEDLVQKKIEDQLKRIQDLMDKLDKKEITSNQVEQMKEEQQNLQSELERLEELAKRLEVQVQMDKLADKVDSAAFQELKIANKINEQEKNTTELNNQRKQQDKLLQDIAKDLKEIEKNNEALQSPIPMDDVKSEQQKAESNIMHSDDNRQKNNMSKSSQLSNEAQKNLAKMSEQLQDKANGLDMNEMEEDVAAMRRLLQNLMKISFNQEAVMKETKGSRINSPEFDLLAKKQMDIRSQTKLIEDSITRLANKNIKTGDKMKEELIALKSNLKQSLDNFEARSLPQVTRNQQYAMMHVNNLTLYFGEGMNDAMSQMNSQKQSKKQGSGNCKNPGGKKPGQQGPKGSGSGEMKDIITQQQKLGNQMQQMQNAKSQKSGQKPGDSPQSKSNKEGKQPGGKQGNSERMQEAEELARLAKAEEDLRKRIQNLNLELKKNGGSGIKELNDIAQQLDKNEEDIINKRLSNEMLARQQEIMSKMLKAEEAIREQEQDNKRQGNAAKPYVPKIPAQLLPYLSPTKNATEKYQGIPPALQDYYQDMLRKYYQNTQK